MNNRDKILEMLKREGPLARDEIHSRLALEHPLLLNLDLEFLVATFQVSRVYLGDDDMKFEITKRSP